MPKIEVSHKDLCGLIGRKLSAEQIADYVLFAKSELDEVNGDMLKVDIKDTNRPDLWSTEGIAREIRGRLNQKGLPKFKLKRGRTIIKVDTKSTIQPIAVCAIAKNLHINEHFLSQIIQLQEKLAVAFGKNRKEISMGVYDMEKISFPVRYTSMPKTKIHFAPLGFKNEMSAKDILEIHPKGKEFGHLMHGDEYPVWIDAHGHVLSMPPIINSNDIGNVTTKTKNVFIECTGYDLKFLQTAIDIIAMQMLDRGADVETVITLNGNKKIITPNLQNKKFYININDINKISGLNLKEKEIIELLEMARYECKLSGKRLELLYPGYRQDVMHERDIIEDAIISYGFNKIGPLIPKIITKGSLLRNQILSERVAEAMIGSGFQEILSYTLTNMENLYAKMNVVGSAVEIEKPTSANWSVFRTTLLPGLLEFLTKNKHIEYPQNIFEIGNVILDDANAATRTKDVIKIAAAVSATVVNYDQISSVLDALLRNLGVEYNIKRSSHPSFIEGRTAEIFIGKDSIGFIGEIHPLVLNNWELENPVVAFELSFKEIFEVLEKR